MKTCYLKLLLISILLITGMTLSASSASNPDNKKENRDVENYTGLVLSVPADLYLMQGDKNELIIEGDEEALSKIITEMKGNELVIRFENWYNYRGSNRLTIYATTKNIENISVTGSGKVISKTPITVNELEFSVTGSGSIIIDNLKAESVESSITGSGKVSLNGDSKISSLEADVTGSGDFESENIEFKNVDLTVTGSGKISLLVSGKLDATVTGSGKIIYKGKPIIDAEITGSGKIVNGN